MVGIYKRIIKNENGILRLTLHISMLFKDYQYYISNYF